MKIKEKPMTSIEILIYIVLLALGFIGIYFGTWILLVLFGR